MRVRRFAVLMLVGVSLPAQDVYSLEKEAALGKRLAEDLHRQSTPVDSPTVQDYLDRLGRRIVAQVPDAKFAFKFSVIAGDPCRTMHEPVALPGGHVFVPAALVLAVQDEAELAGMLAHSMQHIAQRHGTRQAARGTPLIFMGGWAGNCAEGLAIPRGFLDQQRSNELEADVLAVEPMARTGYDPMALVRYLERVQPTTGRIANLRPAIETLPPANYAAPSDELTAAQHEVRRLTESPARSKAPPTLKR